MIIERLSNIFSQSERDGIMVVVVASLFGAFLKVVTTVTVTRFRFMIAEAACSLAAALFAGVFGIWLGQGNVALILWAWAGTWMGRELMDSLVKKFVRVSGVVVPQDKKPTTQPGVTK